MRSLTLSPSNGEKTMIASFVQLESNRSSRLQDSTQLTRQILDTNVKRFDLKYKIQNVI